MEIPAQFQKHFGVFHTGSARGSGLGSGQAQLKLGSEICELSPEQS